MKHIIVNALENIGLRPRELKRQVRSSLVARGFGEWRSLILDEVAFRSVVTTALERLLEREQKSELGDYLEFGVSRGTSMACVHQVLRERDVDLRQIGFDSFEGMPPEAMKQGWRPGSYASTEGATRRYLRSHGVDLSRVSLVKGWFSETLNETTRASLAIEKVSIAMFDCDIYTATKEALDFALPLVGDHAVFIFDDWGWRSDIGKIGQAEAFEECVVRPGTFTTERMSGYIPQSRVFLLERRQAVG